MSSGESNAAQPVDNDTDKLAPKFELAVKAALAECATANLDAVVYEACRSLKLQKEYFKRGRTVIPPTDTVTNADTNLRSWHGYGLAVDVISKSKEWDAGEEWFANVAAIFRRHDCRWGGEWTKPDLPHFQWGLCKPSPSDRARELMAAGGQQAVWDAVGAS